MQLRARTSEIESRPLLKWALLIITALLVLGLLTFALHSIFQQNPPGIDFYVFWNAGRYALFEQGNPYDAEITSRIQMGIYGRPALPTEDEMAYANQPYALLAVLPNLLLPYEWAQPLWMSFNLLLMISLALLLFSQARGRAIASVLLYYPFAFGQILGNFAVLIAGLLLWTSVKVLEQPAPGRAAQVAAGVLLAWSTCKPQFIWLYLLFILLVALKRRWWPLLLAFGGGLLFFLAVSFLLVPGWPALWLERLFLYTQYTRSLPVVLRLLTSVTGWNIPQLAATLIYPLALLCGSWVAWRWWRGKLSTLAALALLGLLTYLAHPHTLAYEQLTFFVPFLLWVLAPPVYERRLAYILIWVLGLILPWLGVILRLDEAWTVLPYALWLAWWLLRQKRPAAQLVPVS